MTDNLIGDLLAASSALLTAEEHLLRVGREESALAYDLAATVMRIARDAIRQALDAPGDARQKSNLLQAASHLDGADAPLTFQAAADLAECAAV